MSDKIKEEKVNFDYCNEVLEKASEVQILKKKIDELQKFKNQNIVKINDVNGTHSLIAVD